MQLFLGHSFFFGSAADTALLTVCKCVCCVIAGTAAGTGDGVDEAE